MQALRQWPGGTVAQAAMEAPHGLDAQVEGGVERQKDGRAVPGLGALQPEAMRSLGIGQDEMGVFAIAVFGEE